MTCRKAAPLLNDLADFGLDEDLSESIRKHLVSCMKCALKFDEISALKILLRNFVTPDPDADYFLKVTDVLLSKVLTDSPVQRRLH